MPNNIPPWIYQTTSCNYQGGASLQPPLAKSTREISLISYWIAVSEFIQQFPTFFHYRVGPSSQSLPVKPARIISSACCFLLVIRLKSSIPSLLGGIFVSAQGLHFPTTLSGSHCRATPRISSNIPLRAGPLEVC